MAHVVSYFRLMRPANLVTAVADILAGIALSGFLLTNSSGPFLPYIFLCLATIGLYGGGVVLNDVFDAELDRIERPERPIPSGKVSIKQATLLAVFLYSIGIVFALQVSALSGIVAIAIAILATVYDKFSKHHAVFGPANMGLCRMLNLLLGVSIIGNIPTYSLYAGLIPLFFISAITLLSRGEVHGAGRKLLLGAGICLLVVLVLLFSLSGFSDFDIKSATPFMLGFVLMIVLPLRKAFVTGNSTDLRKAVKIGVLSLILVDATIGAGFGGITYGVLIVALLPVSIILAKTFAVT
jgi:hypothetical protein